MLYKATELHVVQGYGVTCCTRLRSYRNALDMRAWIKEDRSVISALTMKASQAYIS